MQLTLSPDQRFLTAGFARPQRTLSWALVGGGFGVHSAVVWHFVQRAELPLDVDATSLLRERLLQHGHSDAVGLLTARRLGPYADVSAESRDAQARAIVTVGLGNALRVGDPAADASPVGTINVLCQLSTPLTDVGLLEALALASEARATALLDLKHPSIVSGAAASGTGTDCIVVACPAEGAPRPYCGKHTAAGSALGAAVLRATSQAAHAWQQEHGRGGELVVLSSART